MTLARTIILFCLLERDLLSAKQRIIILIWEAINTPRRPTLLLHIVSWSCRRPRFLVHDRMEVKLANPTPPLLTLARDREVYSLLLGKGRLLVVVLDQVASVGNVPNFFQRHRKADGLLCLPRRATPTSIMGSPQSRPPGWMDTSKSEWTGLCSINPFLYPVPGKLNLTPDQVAEKDAQRKASVANARKRRASLDIFGDGVAANLVLPSS